MQGRVTPTPVLGGCWGGGAEVGFPPALGWRRRFWFTNILQMGQGLLPNPSPWLCPPGMERWGSSGGWEEAGGMSGTSFHLLWHGWGKGGIWPLFWLVRSSEASQPLSHPLPAQRGPEAAVRGRNPPSLSTYPTAGC